ncbi:putative oxidoreductase ZK1290.5 [Trichonephila clavipes]|nr:putative oxidoreductase ZK1290.5 [Trichonephila clavipes]
MPIFGLGTSHSGGYSQEAVVYALKNCNYRLIDTAKRYGCEEFLQSAIHIVHSFPGLLYYKGPRPTISPLMKTCPNHNTISISMTFCTPVHLEDGAQ